MFELMRAYPGLTVADHDSMSYDRRQRMLHHLRVTSGQ